MTVDEIERLRQVLGAFYKTVDVMKYARNSPTHTMNVWADDMKAVEDVMFFLEQLRDGGGVAQAPTPDVLAEFICEVEDRLGPGCDELAVAQAILAKFSVSLSSTDRAPAPSAWQPIETAPRDGTKVDLLYPYPRGRTINCYWRQDDITGPDGGWFWKSPRWGDGGLLHESEWSSSCYPNMEPTHWMPVPALPSSDRGGVGGAVAGTERGDDIKPHYYSPDYQAMGDCRVCGHEQNKPWHSVSRPER